MDETQSELVLDWYLDLESRLSKLLATVPFTDRTQDVFLPHISSVALEASSLIDTVFRSEYQGSDNTKDLNIVSFANHYCPQYQVNTRQTVLFRHPVCYVSPFHGWLDADDNYCSLPWWTAYNKLKHDRIANYELSTLSTAIMSIAALHQVIALLPCFVASLFRRNFILSSDWNPELVADVMRGEASEHGLVAAFETDLFCSSTVAGEFPAKIIDLRYDRYGTSRLSRFLAQIERPPRQAT